jgi:hypothetical protein
MGQFGSPLFIALVAALLTPISAGAQTVAECVASGDARWEEVLRECRID